MMLDEKIKSALSVEAFKILSAWDRDLSSLRASASVIANELGEKRLDFQRVKSIREEALRSSKIRKPPREMLDGEVAELEPPAIEKDLQAEIENLQAISHDLAQKILPLAMRVGRCVDFVKTARTLRPMSAPRLPDEKDLAVAVSATRREIESIEREIEALEVRPAPLEDLRRRAFAEIDKLAARGTPSLSTVVREGSPVDIAQALSFLVVSDQLGVGRITEDAIAFQAWLHREALKARVDDLLMGQDFKNSISTDDLNRGLANLFDRKLKAERIEELLIQKSEAAGLIIARREDADARALLGVY